MQQCWRLLEGSWNRKNSKVFLELEWGQSLKDSEGVGGWSWKNSETTSEQKGGPLTLTIYAPCYTLPTFQDLSISPDPNFDTLHLQGNVSNLHANTWQASPCKILTSHLSYSLMFHCGPCSGWDSRIYLIWQKHQINFSSCGHSALTFKKNSFLLFLNLAHWPRTTMGQAISILTTSRVPLTIATSFFFSFSLKSSWLFLFSYCQSAKFISHFCVMLLCSFKPKSWRLLLMAYRSRSNGEIRFMFESA